jgi:hypothetical protein
MNPETKSIIFRAFTFFYPETHEDYNEVRLKIVMNGGTIVSYPALATIRLARVPCHDREDHYDLSLLDDSLQAGRMVDISDYFIVPATGYAWITQQRDYKEAREREQRARTSTRPTAGQRGERLLPPRPALTTPNNDPWAMRSRNVYTEDDLMRIMDYVLENHSQKHSPNGQVFWITAAAIPLIPKRSDQAIRDQWVKRIRPKYNEFLPIYRAWKGAGKSWRDPYSGKS